jgi:hypothetical protein
VRQDHGMSRFVRNDRHGRLQGNGDKS